MKRILYLLLLICLFTNTKAQTFILASTDPQGDPNQSLSPDAKALSYMLTTDSIIFKMDFYDRIDNKEWNITFGLDTNQNTNDGAMWEGSNQSMNYDLIFRLFFNPAFPPMSGYVTDATQQIVLLSFTAYLSDTSTLIAGLRLSDYSISRPLQFLAGTGIVFGDINDDVPDNNHVSIPTNIFPVGNAKKHTALFAYPNPAENYLQIIFTNDNEQQAFDYEISDLKGRNICYGQVTTENRAISTEHLSPGLYQLKLFNGSSNSVVKFQKN